MRVKPKRPTEGSMTGTVSLRVERVRTALALAVVASLFAACISNRVTVDTSDGEVLTEATTFHVSLATRCRNLAEGKFPGPAS
jgi:hypothetical protein